MQGLSRIRSIYERIPSYLRQTTDAPYPALNRSTFEESPRSLIYPDSFTFQAIENAVTGHVINERGQKISSTLFRPYGEVKGLQVISLATAWIVEDVKIIIDRALSEGLAVIVPEHYGSGLSDSNMDAPHVLGSKNYYEMGHDLYLCIQHAKQRLPNGDNLPVYVLGCSMGSSVALHGFAIHPDMGDKFACAVALIGEEKINKLNQYRHAASWQVNLFLSRLPAEERRKVEHDIARWENTAIEEIFETDFAKHCKEYAARNIEGNSLQANLLRIRRLNPGVDKYEIPKQWVQDAADGCHNLRNARVKFLNSLKGTAVNFIYAENDTFVDVSSIFTFGERLSRINPHVSFSGYHQAPHNLIASERFCAHVLSDVQEFFKPDENLSIEPHIHDFGWYRGDHTPPIRTSREVVPNGLKQQFVGAALWNLWNRWGGTRPPCDLLRELATQAGDAIREAAGNQQDPATLPHSEPEPPDLLPLQA